MKKILTPIIITTALAAATPVVGCAKQTTETKTIEITNWSDRGYIIFDNMPTEWTTGQDLDLSFNITDQSKTLDLDVSNVFVGGNPIKSKDGVVLNDSRLYVPGRYIDNDITVYLQVKSITYKLTNNSDEHIIFENLPTEVTKGWGINTSYTIDNDQLVNTTTSDITLNGQSIKGQSGVIYADGYLQITGDYAQGDIVLALTLRDKKTCNIDTSGCSGITITGLSTSVKEQTKITATYTINEATAVIDKDLSDILVDGVSIAKKSGVKFLDKSIEIPKEYVTGDVTIKIVTEAAKLIDQDWATIIAACDQYETDKDETTFLSKFTIDGAAVSSLDQLIGAKKAITLQFYNESTQQYIDKTQLVRIVDYNHDTISGGNTKAALTFQMVNLLSDVNGNQMRCIYDGEDKNKYSTSKLCDNLTNSEAGKAKWYGKDGKELTDYDDSVYYMMNKGDSVLTAGIKTVDKYVNESSGTYPEYTWTETKIESKIFPAAFTEINLVKEETDPAVETQNVSTYKYWTNHSTASDRIMKDENNNTYHYWLSSPWTNSTSFAWTVTDTGDKNHVDTKAYLFGVTFGFAI